MFSDSKFLHLYSFQKSKQKLFIWHFLCTAIRQLLRVRVAGAVFFWRARRIVTWPIGFSCPGRCAPQVRIHQPSFKVVEGLLHVLTGRTTGLAVGGFVTFVRQTRRCLRCDRRGCFDLALLQGTSHGIHFRISMETIPMQCPYQGTVAHASAINALYASQSPLDGQAAPSVRITR